jgi:hypothetical protein
MQPLNSDYVCSKCGEVYSNHPHTESTLRCVAPLSRAAGSPATGHVPRDNSELVCWGECHERLKFRVVPTGEFTCVIRCSDGTSLPFKEYLHVQAQVDSMTTKEEVLRLPGAVWTKFMR